MLTSPLEAIAEVELRHGVERGSVTTHVGEAGAASAWYLLETGQMPVPAFTPVFEHELAEAGIRLPVAELMAAIEQHTRPRDRMLEAIGRLRAAGFTLGALTNNWEPFSAIDNDGLRSRFDVFVESVREGVNKPHPRIYEIVLERLGLPARQIVYLDDVGRNLKPARHLGMTTIKVTDPDLALAELGDTVGCNLV